MCIYASLMFASIKRWQKLNGDKHFFPFFESYILLNSKLQNSHNIWFIFAFLNFFWWIGSFTPFTEPWSAKPLTFLKKACKHFCRNSSSEENLLMPESWIKISSGWQDEIVWALDFNYLKIKKTSATENWTRVSCVTGRDNSHYTIAD